MPDFDVLIIGAGAAGLSALARLRAAGVSVLCLEARDRVGGRIATVHRPDVPLPIELGPEFIHGRPEQTWRLLAEAGLAAYECEENAVHLAQGEPLQAAESWDQVDQVNRLMAERAANGPDISFEEYLSHTDFAPAIQRAATNYVEGFNAARKEEISIASLALDAQAAAAIEASYNYRIVNGYDSVPQAMARPHWEAIALGQVVEKIAWKQLEVSVTVRSALTNQYTLYTARRVIVTLPLGVLQARSVQFEPEPTTHLAAADRLRFGQVFRMTFIFRQAWWETNEHLNDAGFWLSDCQAVPTWWTALPFRVPMLVGWSSGPHADHLIGKEPPEQVRCALHELAKVSGVAVGKLQRQLRQCFFHDWSSDAFARGAYSYVPVGAMDARRKLAEPLEDTLFFAGEATELDGHSATVHGALATGERVVRQILR